MLEQLLLDQKDRGHHFVNTPRRVPSFCVYFNNSMEFSNSNLEALRTLSKEAYFTAISALYLKYIVLHPILIDLILINFRCSKPWIWAYCGKLLEVMLTFIWSQLLDHRTLFGLHRLFVDISGPLS